MNLTKTETIENCYRSIIEWETESESKKKHAHTLKSYAPLSINHAIQFVFATFFYAYMLSVNRT